MPRRLDPAIVDRAIDWSIRLQFNAAGADVIAAFEAWRSAAPEHAEAWQRIQSVDARFDGVDPSVARATLSRRRQASRRRSLKIAGVLTAGLAIWYGRRSAPWERAVADYATATGQRRSLRLADDTLLVLNTDSAVNIHFDNVRRSIELVRGEIFVVTGADTGTATHRPFSIQTTFGSLRALGTRFFVRLDDADARLIVTQGAVEIAARNGARALGRAGDGYVFNSDGATRLDLYGLDTDGWLDGVLTAREQPLGRFLSELSRYRPGMITCDPAVAQRRLSGVFQTADTDKTLQLVAANLQLRLSYRTRFWVVVSAATSPKEFSS
ncbi:MAG: FecR domain-containing protein [Janthinobacterium lividum]